MTINETPVDCFRVKYFISGSEQEIIEEETSDSDVSPLMASYIKASTKLGDEAF